MVFQSHTSPFTQLSLSILNQYEQLVSTMSKSHRRHCNRSKASEDPCDMRAKFVAKDLHEKIEARFLEIVQTACQIYDDLVDLSTAIKQTMDETYGPTWHVVVGPNFAR